MPTLNRLFRAIAMGALVVGGTAYAEEPTLTDPPQTAQCEPDVPPADCPQAQAEPVQPAPPMTTEEPTIVAEQEEEEWYDRIGIGLSLGGGVDDFTSGIPNDATSLGGSWNVRATFGTKSYVAFEASYFGSAQSVDTLGLNSGATLIGNGLQGALRINVIEDYVVQPFIYGGAAWRHYDLSNVNFNTSDIRDSDDVFELPAGIGVAGYIGGGFMADLRAEYRWAWGDNLMSNVVDPFDDGTSMDRWGVTANLGMEF